ncbi:phytoene/squalene synthase family protein [Flavihumibacter petaseus]|uniref:Phytoene synthase n=1 Tax=Flavihumibacter petaseus NBRC 106054 TaxID=1220578 RepID=A0A0E9MXV3_9BACT|nr:phytoene/squalene synthase family protein [Flavihumibacter petaseus]GAO42343.1 phytoene synthase [Flavihumibacter petaseus NBRC 106054]
MKQLFDELSREVSRKTTEKYSTSFSLGILALQASIRPAIYAIYGYVRLADEIVDSFHGYNKERLLNNLKEETVVAIREGISINPILQSFQETVNRYHIDHELIDQFLHSMAMDLHKMDYNSASYDEYIYGSAEVVGLMCLQVFTEGNRDKYLELKPYARKLGSAFQKVNFLRDLNDDYTVLGRTYFPDIDMGVFDNCTKARIEKEIETEFKEALIGIRRLPRTAIFGVYLAYRYYLSLFKKIRQRSSAEILENRVRIPNTEKALVALKSYLRYKIAFL